MYFFIECCIEQEVRKSFLAEAVRVKENRLLTLGIWQDNWNNVRYNIDQSSIL